ILSPRPGFNQKDVNRQFTKLSWESHHPEGVAVMLRRAIKVAATAPCGPVYLGFPNTVLEDAPAKPVEVVGRERFLSPSDIPPNPRQIEKMAGWLLRAKKPALILGDEVFKYQAQEAVLRLAEMFNIPVHESTLPAFHCFPRRHPLFAGKFDPNRKDGYDLVINVGNYDLGDYDIGEDFPLVPPAPYYQTGTRVVRFSLDADAIGRNNAFSLGFVSNVKLTLEELLRQVQGKAPPPQQYRLKTPAEGRPQPDACGQGPL